MSLTQGALATVAVAAVPQGQNPPTGTGPAAPGKAIAPIAMNFGAGVRKIEVQGY